MAAEARRGCGYRKIGGVYLVGGRIGVACDRLPYELEICPCCGHAMAKQGRGLAWLNIGEYVKGPHMLAGHRCREGQSCSFCALPEAMGEVLVHWVGAQFYPTPADFLAEGIAQGFSRRIAQIPRDFKLGETYVFLAHPNAIEKWVPASEEATKLLGMDAAAAAREKKYFPGFFYIWMPQRIERILNESQRGSKEVEALEKRGITPVFVPDNDPDHHNKSAKAKEGNLFEEEEG